MSCLTNFGRLELLASLEITKCWKNLKFECRQRPPIKKIHFGNGSQKIRKNRYQSFLVPPSIIGFLYFVPIFCPGLQIRRSLSRDDMAFKIRFDHVDFKHECCGFQYVSQKVEKFHFTVYIIINMITVFLFSWNFMEFYLHGQ